MIDHEAQQKKYRILAVYIWSHNLKHQLLNLLQNLLMVVLSIAWRLIPE